MISQEIRLRFWDAVIDCLVVFHGLDEAQAYKKTKEFRRRLSELDRPDERVMPSEIVYHEEPFYIACDLMDNQLDFKRHYDRYRAILDTHGW